MTCNPMTRNVYAALASLSRRHMDSYNQHHDWSERTRTGGYRVPYFRASGSRSGNVGQGTQRRADACRRADGQCLGRRAVHGRHKSRAWPEADGATRRRGRNMKTQPCAGGITVDMKHARLSHSSQRRILRCFPRPSLRKAWPNRQRGGLGATASLVANHLVHALRSWQTRTKAAPWRRPRTFGPSCTRCGQAAQTRGLSMKSTGAACTVHACRFFRGRR